MKDMVKDQSEAAPSPVLRGPPRFYATEGTKEGFGPYSSTIEKYLPRIAEADVLVLRPSDLLRPGEEATDMRALKEGDPATYLGRLRHMSTVLQDLPGWDTTLPEIADTSSGLDSFSQEQQDQLAAMAEVYESVIYSGRGPTAYIYKDFDKDILVINMFDTPEETRDFIQDHLSGLPKSLSEELPEVAALDWHVITICHEAGHGPALQRHNSGERRYQAGAEFNDRWLASNLNVLGFEIEADQIGIKNYFNLRAEGLPLAANSAKVFEALRAISALERTSNFDQEWIRSFNTHMTSPFYDVLEDAEAAEKAFGTAEAVPAALYVNTMANRLIQAVPEENRYYGMEDSLSLPLPLKRYAAVKQLQEAGHFEAGTPEEVIAREYLDAFENYVPEINDPASEAYGAKIQKIYETSPSLQKALNDPALEEKRLSLQDKFRAMATSEAPDSATQRPDDISSPQMPGAGSGQEGPVPEKITSNKLFKPDEL